MSFLDTGYGYRLSQNLTSKNSQIGKGETSQDLVSAEKALSSRAQGPNVSPKDLSKASGETSNGTTPRYKHLTYQPNTIRSARPMQNTPNNQLFQKKAVIYEPAIKKHSVLVPSTMSSRDYLSFFVLKANYLNNKTH